MPLPLHPPTPSLIPSMPDHSSSRTVGSLKSWIARCGSSLSAILSRFSTGNSPSDPSADVLHPARPSRSSAVTVDGRVLSLWTYYYPHEALSASETPAAATDSAATGAEPAPSLGNLQYLTMGSPGGGGEIVAVPWHGPVGGSEQHIQQDSVLVRGDQHPPDPL